MEEFEKIKTTVEYQGYYYKISEIVKILNAYPFKSAKKDLKYLIKSGIIEEKDMKESDNHETKEKKFKF
jgi:hypothetical protein